VQTLKSLEKSLSLYLLLTFSKDTVYNNKELKTEKKKANQKSANPEKGRV
jgi:hypothetical protein